MEKKVLVTGGRGLVGSALDADVKIGREYDLTNTNETRKMFEYHQPTHVIHCAGKVGGVGGNMNHKGEYFYDNIMMNTNVIEEARRSGVKKLVSFLSTCVFPDDVEYPLTEEKIHKGEPHFSNNAYAYAKRMADVQINAYREQYGLNYTSVIPTNIYGPNDNYDTKNSHFLPALIKKIHNARIKNKKTITLWGNGKSKR